MASPAKHSSRSCTKKNDTPISAPASTCTQKVIFIPDNIGHHERMECIHLRHPRSSDQATFLLASDGSEEIHLAELNTFDEGNRSWFIGSTVMSDGKLYIASPYNPVYLILPYLMKASRHVPLDQLLEDKEFPAVVRLAASAAPHMSWVADRKGSTDLNVWAYNEEKTMTWLERRAHKLATVLMEKKVPTTTAQALTFVRTMNQEQTQDAYLNLAHGILSEYLPEKLSCILRKRLALADPVNSSRKQQASDDADGQRASKKQKTEGPVEDYFEGTASQNKKVSTPMTAKDRALAKSAVGNKSIMSFFSKK